jgi:hypothetical protein
MFIKFAVVAQARIVSYCAVHTFALRYRIHYNALCCVAQVIIPLTFRVTTREMISSRIATVRRRPQTLTVPSAVNRINPKATGPTEPTKANRNDRTLKQTVSPGLLVP